MKIIQSIRSGAFTAGFAGFAAVSTLTSSAAAQKLFWTDLDTTVNPGLVESLPIPASGVPAGLFQRVTHDVTIDTPNQLLYWTETSTGTGYVMRGPATGGSPTQVAAQAGSAWKVGYVKDNANQEWVYWTDVTASGLIWRKNITTGAANQLLPLTTFHGLAIDKRPSQLKLYTADSSGVIWKSDLAGANAVALTSGPIDVAYGTRVHGLCIDTINDRLWAVGVSDVTHPGPTQSWVKWVSLGSGAINAFLTSPLGQGDPVGFIGTQLVDIAYDCVANDVYWTSTNASVKSTIRRANVVSGVLPIYYQPPGAYSGRFEGLALDSNAPCSQFQSYCAGDTIAVACPCNNFSVAGSGQGCANSLGTGALLSANGQASVSLDSMQLHGELMPNSSALYFQGSTPQNAGLGSAFGDGLRCAAGSVARLGVKINAGGASSYPLPGVDLPISVKGTVSAGDARYYQCWYRNSAVFCSAGTYNLSNGMKVEWGP